MHLGALQQALETVAQAAGGGTASRRLVGGGSCVVRKNASVEYQALTKEEFFTLLPPAEVGRKLFTDILSVAVR